MPNVMVLNAGGYPVSECDYPVIGWKNKLASADTKPPGTSALTDYMNTVKQSYNGGGFVEIATWEFLSLQTFSYWAMANFNKTESNTAVTVEFWTGSEWVEPTGFSGDPSVNETDFIFPFDELSASKVRLSIFRQSINAPDTEIGEFSCGDAITFPRPVSVGYEPKAWNSQDEVTNGRTQSDAIGRSTVISKGSREVVPINKIHYKWMNDNWSDFVREAQGYPIWLAWRPNQHPYQCIYGTWEATTATYQSALFSGLTITVRG